MISSRSDLRNDGHSQQLHSSLRLNIMLAILMLRWVLTSGFGSIESMQVQTCSLEPCAQDLLSIMTAIIIASGEVQQSLNNQLACVSSRADLPHLRC